MATDLTLTRVERLAVDSPAGLPLSRRSVAPPTAAPAFDAVLAEQNRLRVSNHAEKRLSARDIYLGAPEVQRLAEAVDRAAAKGGRDSLILMDDLAFIVDVPQRMIVTAVSPDSRKEGVFTNIDTVVLAK